MTAQEQLATFTLENLPTLDVAVLGALELFSTVSLPELNSQDKQRIVLGSVNAYKTAKLIYGSTSAVFGDESNFEQVLADNSKASEVVVISASGSKHAVAMVEAAQARGFTTYLITNTKAAPAAATIEPGRVILFPKNREPYTYNTSTYLGPILAYSQESPINILHFLETDLSAKLLRNFADYRAFTFILPDEFAPLVDMISTKFDELFGPMLCGRAFTESEIMHAKTVVESGEELFIALGVENEHYGLRKNRLQLTVPEGSEAAAYMSVSYFIIGQIQRAKPPHFKKNLAAYCERASAVFGHDIKPIVE